MSLQPASRVPRSLLCLSLLCLSLLLATAACDEDPAHPPGDAGDAGLTGDAATRDGPRSDGDGDAGTAPDAPQGHRPGQPEPALRHAGARAQGGARPEAGRGPAGQGGCGLAAQRALPAQRDLSARRQRLGRGGQARGLPRLPGRDGADHRRPGPRPLLVLAHRQQLAHLGRAGAGRSGQGAAGGSAGPRHQRLRHAGDARLRHPPRHLGAGAVRRRRAHDPGPLARRQRRRPAPDPQGQHADDLRRSEARRHRDVRQERHPGRGQRLHATGAGGGQAVQPAPTHLDLSGRPVHGLVPHHHRQGLPLGG